MKKVYVGMCADLIHHGHVNIIQVAAAYGSVTVGLLSDEAITTYKRPPVWLYEQRKIVIENLRWVDQVVKQRTLSYKENLEAIRPDYVVHADDWQSGPQQETRQEAIETIGKWDGILIEVPYTQGISSTKLRDWYEQESINYTKPNGDCYGW